MPVRDLAERLSGEGAATESTSGAALISHRPRIGSEAYAVVLFPGVVAADIDTYLEIQRGAGWPVPDIPQVYRSVLTRLNGASLFGITLFGIPPSMARYPPLLDRSTRSPLDIGSANLHWRKPYEADPEKFYFGGGPHSNEENAGYFLDADGKVEALLRGGAKLAAWTSIQDFLAQEIARAELLFPEYEATMGRILQQAQQEHPRRRRSVKRPGQ